MLCLLIILRLSNLRIRYITKYLTHRIVAVKFAQQSVAKILNILSFNYHIYIPITRYRLK